MEESRAEEKRENGETGEKGQKPAKKRRRWPWVILGFFILFSVGGYAFYEYSNTPEFCNSCHIMHPYVKAWAESKHGHIACVECHIAPDTGAKWQAKIQGMMQALKYLTRTYGTKPYAEIEDASCLRSGCHDQRVVEEHSTASFKNNVVFDHKPHITEVRRGKQLRCTSCHAQIVVGNHMEVTTTTCYLCHFKESDKHDVEKLSDCRLCHKLLPDRDVEHQVMDPAHPDTVLETVTFNHVDYIGDRNVDCKSCHLNAIEGDGPARQDRCFVCHNDPEHLKRISDIEFIHDNHITEHNVTCERCHDPIRHETRPQVTALDQSCSNCHDSMHAGQREMYMGVGGRGVAESMPAAMFQSLVDCSGCHVGRNVTDPLSSHFSGFTRIPDYQGCRDCHGDDADGYIEMFDGSKDEVKERLAEVKSLLNRAAPAARTAAAKQEVRDAFAVADYNIRFVELAHGGAHNPAYSMALLEAAEASLKTILER